jgi:hypothetical protein
MEDLIIHSADALSTMENFQLLWTSFCNTVSECSNQSSAATTNVVFEDAMRRLRLAHRLLTESLVKIQHYSFQMQEICRQEQMSCSVFTGMHHNIDTTNNNGNSGNDINKILVDDNDSNNDNYSHGSNSNNNSKNGDDKGNKSSGNHSSSNNENSNEVGQPPTCQSKQLTPSKMIDLVTKKLSIIEENMDLATEILHSIELKTSTSDWMRFALIVSRGSK